MNRARRRPPAIVLAAAVVTVAFFAVPLVALLQRAAWTDLWSHLTSETGREALRLSLLTSLGAAALSIVFGTPLAWVLARTEVPGRAVIRSLVLLPMVLPPVVGGVSLLSAFSLSSPIGGWLHRVAGIQFTFTAWGTLLAGTFVSMPFFVLAAEGAFRGMDVRYEHAAASLGADRFTTFRRITVPMVAPSLVAGVVLAWARALGEFGATITFAGNIEGRTRTLPLAIYLALESRATRPVAVSLSIVLLTVSLVVLVALRDRWWSTS